MGWKVYYKGKAHTGKAYNATNGTVLINGEWIALNDLKIIEK